MSFNTVHPAHSTSFGPPLPGIAHLLQPPPSPEERTISNLNRDHSIVPSSPSTRFLLRPPPYRHSQPPPRAPLPFPLPSFSDVLSATNPDLIQYTSPLTSRDASESHDDDYDMEEEEEEAEYEIPRQEIESRGPVSHRRTRAKPEQMAKLMERWNETLFPTYEQRKETAAQTGLTSRQVQVWFQNRRSKEKKNGTLVRPLPQVDAPKKVKRHGPRKISERSIANLLQRRRDPPNPTSYHSTPQPISHPPPDPRYLSILRSPYEVQAVSAHPSSSPSSSTIQTDQYFPAQRSRFEPTSSYRPRAASSSSSSTSERLRTPFSRPGTASGRQQLNDRFGGSCSREYRWTGWDDHDETSGENRRYRSRGG